MIRFTVTWLEGAQNHLAQIWVDAPDRQAVTEAANEIDLKLATDATSKGIPLSEGLRSLYIPPLHVLFTVSELDRLVVVVSVRSDQNASANPQANGQDESTN